MMDPKDVGEWQHEEFYCYVAQAHNKPRYSLHYKADAPLNIRSIFYVPEMVSTGARRPLPELGTSPTTTISHLQRHFPQMVTVLTV